MPVGAADTARNLWMETDAVKLLDEGKILINERKEVDYSLNVHHTIIRQCSDE